MDPGSSPTFALIPGAGTDARVWEATIAALRARGHDAIAPALPLHDQSAGPSAHAEAVAHALDGRSGIVVVAQSLGAFAGPLVAAHVPVDQVILLAPMIPRPAETAGEWWENTRHAEAIADLIERHGPMSSWGPEAMSEIFLHDVDPAVASRSERLSGAPGAGMFTEPWPLECWPDVPTRVLVPREDRLFPREFQRRVTQERLGLEIDEMNGGHLPMLARPAELSGRLLELAAEPTR